jgi:hypothetical protein
MSSMNDTQRKALPKPYAVEWWTPRNGGTWTGNFGYDWPTHGVGYKRGQELFSRAQVEKLLANAAANQASALPLPGWQMVPIEPTEEMRSKAMTAWMTRRPFDEVYAALLTAARACRTEGPSMINLSEIEKAAKAATPGKWFPVHDVILTDIPGHEETDFPAVASCVGDDNAEANAAHIANMDPATVLALVAVVRAASLVAKPVESLYDQEKRADYLAALREALAPFAD